MSLTDRICVSLLFMLAFTGLAMASANIETWDSDTSGWLIKDYFGGTAYGTLDWVSSLDGETGVLRDTGGSAISPPPRDIIYTTAASDPGLVGDLSGNGLTVAFDFYTESAVPVGLDIFLLSSEGGGDYEWFLDVTSQVSASGWSGISGGIGGSSWYNTSGRTQSQFSSDLTDIDQIGIRISYLESTGGQVYALDNFDVIPEPETWAFLGIAFLSVGFSFRDRLDKAMLTAKAWIRG